MSLSTTISRILGDEHARLIDFHIAGLHITGRGLGRVAQSITSGDIAVCPRDNMSTAARYRFTRDEMHVASDLERQLQGDDSANVKALIVHEGVHALADLEQLGSMTSLQSESSGFLAQAWYRLKANGGRPHRSRIEIFQKAQQVVINAGLLDNAGRTVAWNDYQELREAIQRHPNYAADDRDASAGANGIRRQGGRCRV